MGNQHPYQMRARATLHVDPSLERWTQARLAIPAMPGPSTGNGVEHMPDPLSALLLDTGEGGVVSRLQGPLWHRAAAGAMGPSDRNRCNVQRLESQNVEKHPAPPERIRSKMERIPPHPGSFRKNGKQRTYSIRNLEEYTEVWRTKRGVHTPGLVGRISKQRSYKI